MKLVPRGTQTSPAVGARWVRSSGSSLSTATGVGTVSEDGGRRTREKGQESVLTGEARLVVGKHEEALVHVLGARRKDLGGGAAGRRLEHGDGGEHLAGDDSGAGRRGRGGLHGAKGVAHGGRGAQHLGRRAMRRQQFRLDGLRHEEARLGLDHMAGQLAASEHLVGTLHAAATHASLRTALARSRAEPRHVIASRAQPMGTPSLPPTRLPPSSTISRSVSKGSIGRAERSPTPSRTGNYETEITIFTICRDVIGNSIVGERKKYEGESWNATFQSS